VAATRLFGYGRFLLPLLVGPSSSSAVAIVFSFRLQRVSQHLCVGEGDALGRVAPVASVLVVLVVAGTEVPDDVPRAAVSVHDGKHDFMLRVFVCCRAVASAGRRSACMSGTSQTMSTPTWIWTHEQTGKSVGDCRDCFRGMPGRSCTMSADDSIATAPRKTSTEPSLSFYFTRSSGRGATLIPPTCGTC